MPLDKGHDLVSFCSADDGLDGWLHRSARPMGGEGLNRTHLWVDDQSSEILGYFALAPTIVTTDPFLGESAPALLLAKLAMCEALRGKKPPAGDLLLLAVFETVLKAADLVGGKFLVTDTKHERAAEFYARNKFEPIEGDESRLIIKMSAIRRVLQ
ncbi:hypothetical protein [Nocardioides pyridinolyticus]